jgi:hypothetical protein
MLIDNLSLLDLTITWMNFVHLKSVIGDTNSGRTGSGVEANAIGCWHAVAETGLSSSSTCTLLVAVSTQDL